MEWNPVARCQDGLGVGADFVGDIAAVREHAIAADDHQVDLAAGHEVAGGVIRDDLVRDAFLGEFPRGERCALQSRPRFIAIDMEFHSGSMGCVERGSRAADVHERQPTRVAMGQDAQAGADQRSTVLAQGAALGDIGLGKSLRRLQRAALALGHTVPCIHVLQDAPQGVGRIDRRGARLGQCAGHMLDVTVKCGAATTAESTGSLGETEGGRGSDRPRATHRHVTDRARGCFEGPAAQAYEAMRELSLVNQDDGIGGGVERDRAYGLTAAVQEDIHGGRVSAGAAAEFRSRNCDRGNDMKCFVTGASGFVGANLVHELANQGHEVRALLRAGSDLRGLEGARYERVEGNLHDAAALRRGLAGCDWCFHVAASYHLWLPDYRPMYADNVDGTRRVIEAAATAGCARIVYTSTVGCIGVPNRAAPGPLRPSDERATATAAQMTNHYKRSKWQAEQLALELAGRGLPVVIVNPSAPVGPRDVKPTPTGKVIVDFLKRAMPGYLDTGLNWVHVRDVAQGHILAAEKGRVGERYILGHAEGNWTMKQTFDTLAQMTGVRAPGFRVPYLLAWTAAVCNEALARVTGIPPKAPLGGVRMGRYLMFFDPTKAIRELGLPQTPPARAFAEAIAWFVERGYAPAPPRLRHGQAEV